MRASPQTDRFHPAHATQVQRQLFFWQRRSKLHFSSLGCKPLLAWGGAEGGRRRGLEWNWTLNVCVQSQHFQFTARRRRSARHSYARPPQPPGKKRTEGRAGRHRTRQPPVRRARCRGAAPPRQTDPRWQATHLGGSGSSRAGNSLTLFIPAILVSPPSPRSFRHIQVDTLS